MDKDNDSFGQDGYSGQRAALLVGKLVDKTRVFERMKELNELLVK